MKGINDLTAMLRKSVERCPEAAVFIDRGECHDYAKLDRQSHALAGALVGSGFRPGDRAVLALPNSFEYLTAYYGILKAGGVVVPHYPDTRTQALCHVLRHSGARALLLPGRNLRLLQGCLDQVPALSMVMCLGPRSALEDAGHVSVIDIGTMLDSDEPAGALVEARPDDLCSIVYTSGTTGHPKGVMLTHANLLANTRSIVEYLRLGTEDRVGLVLPLFYVYGNSLLQTHVYAGGCLVHLGSMAFPTAVLKGLGEHRCTGLSGVPSTFARLVQIEDIESYDLPCLRYLTQAGGPMTPALTARLRRAIPHARLFIMYGQTEAAARLTYLPPEDLERKSGSAGRAIPGVELFIMDAQGREVPRGDVGEIVARGENIMTGYWQDPEETARVLRPWGLCTGDLARMDEEGFIFIVGRSGDMIKSGAHRIGPREIEEVIERLPGVAECAVVGVPDEILGEAIAAFVVPVTETSVDERQILRICHEHLPRFKLPAHVRLLKDLPRTPSGKLRRRDLPALL